MFVGYLSLLAAVSASPLAPADKEFDLILFGATGCIGHLAAEYVLIVKLLKTFASTPLIYSRTYYCYLFVQISGDSAQHPQLGNSRYCKGG